MPLPYFRDMILFHSEDRKIPSQIRREQARKWLQQIARRNKKKIVSLNYIFCSDEYLHKMNKQFLDHDTLTDIITFGYSDTTGSQTISGDIFISIDRVSENARIFGTTKKQEVHRVLVHGLLHLCGFKDKSPAQEKQMRAKENESLSLLFNHTP